MESLAAAGPWQRSLDKLRSVGTDAVEFLPSLVVAAVVLLVFVLAGRAVRAVVLRLGRYRGEHWRVGILLGRLSLGLAVVLGVLVACVILFPNFTPTSLVQFLGLGSVAVGFAFRDVLQNYLAGILMLLTQPFRIGDQIGFQDYEGTVEDIQARATYVTTYDGRRVVIPNAELFTHAVTVNTAFDRRRLEYDLGIGYADDVARAKALILEALRELDAALDDPPPEVLAYALAESSVTLRVRWWIHPPRRQDALDARDAVIAAVKAKLLSNGIDLPFPVRRVLLHDQTGGGGGAEGGDWPAARPVAAGQRRG